jgi:probable F420-dependent oxidoreductase
VTARALRFGISVRDHDVAVWARQARDIEARGFSTLVLADHLTASFDPLPALAAAAAATTTLRVGTFVLNNDLRHPVLVARAALTIDALSGGRFELGLGAGHMRSEYDEVGLAFDDGAVRVSRLEESVAIIRPMLRGEAVTHTGSSYRVTDHQPFPPPAQAPAVPLLVGGNGRRVHELAARAADIVGFVGFTHREGGAAVDVSSFTAERLDQQVAAVRAAAGERFAELELNALLQLVAVTDDAAAVLRPLLDRTGLSLEDARTSPYLLVGPVEQLADQLLERRERFGVTYWVGFGSALDDLTAVMDEVARRS